MDTLTDDRISPTDPPTEPGAAPLAPLGSRFLRVWFGQTVSTVGSALSGVGVAVFVYLETGSEAWLGVLAALGALPFVLVGPFLGIVDRFPKRSVMIGADVFAAIGPAFALVMALTDRLEVWHLAVAAVLGGIGTAVQGTASMAAVPSLVESEAIGRANGLAQLGPAIAIVIGPLLATPLVAWWGIEAVLWADFGTFVFGMVLTLITPFADVATTGEVEDDGSWRAAWTWLYVSGRPLLVLLLAMSVVNFSLSFFNLGLLVTATSVGGPARAGLALAVGGVAMIAGSLLLAQRGVSSHRIRTISRALLLVAFGTAIAASRPVFALVIVGVGIALGAVPAANAAMSTVFHERTPASMYGRVFGLRSTIGSALGPLGSVVAGFVIARLAGPALESGGSLSGSVGAVIGTGRERGAALILLGVAATLTVLALALRRSRTLAPLDAPVAESETESWLDPVRV